MFNSRIGPVKFLVIAGVLAFMYLYMGTERRVDTQAIADRDPWFDRHIQSEMGPVLVKFGAERCGPCRSLDANLRAVEPRFQGRMKFVRVDVDQHPDLAQTFGVRSIPRSFVLYQGRIVESRRGSMEKEALMEWITQALEKAYRASPHRTAPVRSE